MTSFTFRLTTAGKLLALIKNHFQTEDRKRWHNLEAGTGDLCPVCNKGKLVPTIATDPANDDVYHFAKCEYCGHSTD